MVTPSSRTMELKKDPKKEAEKTMVKRRPEEAAAHVELKLKKPRTRDFVEEIKSEFRNITWTSKGELQTYTKIVIGATFVLGLSVYLVDLAIQTALSSLTWITRLTVG